MKVKDLTGKQYGSLSVLRFDAERYEEDKAKVLHGELGRVRRYYICRCMECGREVSVRGENLVSGNTKGCGCDMYKKSASTRHEKCKNRYEYDDVLGCWRGYATNTGKEFLFDDNMYDVVSQYCWYETGYGYIMTRLSKKEQIFLHRLVLFGLESKSIDDFVDHINRNKTDCRRCNLRRCTPKENSWNHTVADDTISGIIGVSWYAPSKKWRAYISVDGKFISLGYFENKDEAVAARRIAELQYYGEFAPKE